MISPAANQKVYLAIQSIDCRKGIDGLAALCKTQWSLDPFSGHYFIFRNRRARAIKILIYDSSGFWLCYKRLSTGKFNWPKTTASIVLLDLAQLKILLNDNSTNAPWQLVEP